MISALIQENVRTLIPRKSDRSEGLMSKLFSSMIHSFMVHSFLNKTPLACGPKQVPILLQKGKYVEEYVPHNLENFYHMI